MLLENVFYSCEVIFCGFEFFVKCFDGFVGSFNLICICKCVGVVIVGGVVLIVI